MGGHHIGGCTFINDTPLNNNVLDGDLDLESNRWGDTENVSLINVKNNHVII